MRGKRLAVYSVIITVMLIFTSCGKKRDIHYSADNEIINVIDDAGSFDDVFKLDKEIQLSKDSYFISDIASLLIGKKNELIIFDNKPECDVVIFDEEGKFIKILAKHGEWPGEYRFLQGMAINSKNELIVYEAVRSKIIIYDSLYNYVNSFNPRTPFGIPFIDRKNNLFFYESMVIAFKKAKNRNSIYKIDYNGDTVKSFAPFSPEVLKLDFSVRSAGLAFDKDNFLYEMNPIFYEIRKFDSEGNLIKNFGKAKLGLKETDIGNGQKYNVPIIYKGPYIFDSNILMVESEGKLDFYDTEGNLIKSGIKSEKSITAAIGNYLYIVKNAEKDGNAVIQRYKFR